MIPEFKERFLIKLFDENDKPINNDPIVYDEYPSKDHVTIEMDYYRTRYPFKETKYFKVEKITYVDWVDEDE